MTQGTHWTAMTARRAEVRRVLVTVAAALSGTSATTPSTSTARSSVRFTG